LGFSFGDGLHPSIREPPPRPITKLQKNLGGQILPRIRDGCPIGLADVVVEARTMTQTTTDLARECPESTDWSDTRLMARYRDTRDRRAMDLLFERNRDKFLATVRRKFGFRLHGVDPEDIVQDAFINMCRYPDHFRDDAADSFAAWSGGILRNAVHSWTRKSMRHATRASLTPELVAGVADDVPGPAKVAEMREAADTVDDAYLILLQLYAEAFGRLSESDRELLHLVEIEAMSYRAIAERLGVRFETIKVRVFRARSRIWKAVARHLNRCSMRRDHAA